MDVSAAQAHYLSCPVFYFWQTVGLIAPRIVQSGRLVVRMIERHCPLGAFALQIPNRNLLFAVQIVEKQLKTRRVRGRFHQANPKPYTPGSESHRGRVRGASHQHAHHLRRWPRRLWQGTPETTSTPNTVDLIPSLGALSPRGG